MTILKGHFDGKHVVVDEPIPGDLAPHTPVKIIIESLDARRVLDQIAEMAVSTDELPPDYSQQHDHYVKGTPRK